MLLIKVNHIKLVLITNALHLKSFNIISKNDYLTYLMFTSQLCHKTK